MIVSSDDKFSVRSSATESDILEVQVWPCLSESEMKDFDSYYQ